MIQSISVIGAGAMGQVLADLAPAVKDVDYVEDAFNEDLSCARPKMPLSVVSREE